MNKPTNKQQGFGLFNFLYPNFYRWNILQNADMNCIEINELILTWFENEHQDLLSKAVNIDRGRAKVNIYFDIT